MYAHEYILLNKIFKRLMNCDVVNFTRHLKRCSGKLTGMTVGLCPEEKVVWRETTLRCHPRALVTITTHYPHLRFLSRLFHAQYEDDSTRGRQRRKRDVTGSEQI